MSAPGLAVENARKMSPEPLPDVLPVRARPSVARRARRFSWCGSSGASVATTMMIEPTSPRADRRQRRLRGVCGISRPTGTPAIVQLRAPAEVALHEHADACSRPPFASSSRDAVPMPPLKP